ncbi:ABC transporter ATP-binding protein, partial [Nonomuraea sp. KC401]
PSPQRVTLALLAERLPPAGRRTPHPVPVRAGPTDGAPTDGAPTDGAATDGAATDGAATDDSTPGGSAVGHGDAVQAP